MQSKNSNVDVMSSSENAKSVSESSVQKWSDGNVTKYHVSQRALSARRQSHNLKYEQSHALQKLERWYIKITSPKPKKSTLSRKVYVNNSGLLIRAEKKPRVYKPRERDAIRLAEFKRSTRWVARSEEEYIWMHSH